MLQKAHGSFYGELREGATRGGRGCRQTGGAGRPVHTRVVLGGKEKSGWMGDLV